MNSKRRNRLVLLTMMVVGVGVTVSLVLFALNKNINLYYTPSQLNTNPLPRTNLRIGGLVKKGSLNREPNSLKMHFIITDLVKEVTIEYTGIVPSLFREGQGVVVEGHFISNTFRATQVLAKHDEKYMPPGIKKE
ncbi:MAG: cytochrome c maturation protein CcmE [Gammaproteobacteria bacterium]|nr:cytochrome c maturation protein CcmE [Gammaproteobacteria bacterium]